ncbi:MAG TPA: translation elongation factor Ts [Anaerolineales bacterium]
MAISIEQIKQLREETGAGVLDCRKALETYDGDFEKAKEYLREKGLAKAAKRADRIVTEGMLELYSHGNGRVGVMVEVNCETDFVARSESFRKFAHEVALQIAAGAPKYIRVEDVPAEVLEQERQKAQEMARVEGKSENEMDQAMEDWVEKFYKDNCLLQQNYVRDEKITLTDLRNQHIAAIGENIVIRRFARWEVGEDAQQ